MISVIDIDREITRSILNGCQRSVYSYIMLGYKIYNIDDSRLRKTKAYRRYMSIKGDIYTPSLILRNGICNVVISDIFNNYKFSR